VKDDNTEKGVLSVRLWALLDTADDMLLTEEIGERQSTCVIAWDRPEDAAAHPYLEMSPPFRGSHELVELRVADQDAARRILSTGLCCIRVIGPGSIIAQPDVETAEKRAIENNAYIKKMLASDPHPDDPHMECVVELWCGTIAEHAEELAKHGGNPKDWC
jgi:hypothetical protein